MIDEKEAARYLMIKEYSQALLVCIINAYRFKENPNRFYRAYGKRPSLPKEAYIGIIDCKQDIKYHVAMTYYEIFLLVTDQPLVC